MYKVDVFFTKSNTFWSKFINWFYRTFFNKKTTYTHCGLLFNGQIFEIDISKKSGFYSRELGEKKVIKIGNITQEEFDNIINKYRGLNYDMEEIVLLAKNKNNVDKDEQFICSTLVAYMLLDLGFLSNYNYETINPDGLFNLLGDYK